MSLDSSEYIKSETLIGIATIAIFSYLPFAVTSLQDLKTAFDWDRQVLLNYIIDMPAVIILTLLTIVVPILLWRADIGTPPTSIQTLLFGSFVMGIGSYIIAAVKTYAWLGGIGGKSISDYRAEKRFQYLQELPDRDKLSVWNTATWQQLKKQPASQPEKLISLFAENMRVLQDKNIAANIINELKDNLHILPLSNPEIYNTLFNLAFQYRLEKKMDWYFNNSIDKLQTRFAEVSLIIKPPAAHYNLSHLFFEGCREQLKDDQKKKLEFIDKVIHISFQILQDNDCNSVTWGWIPAGVENNFYESGG